MKLILFTFFTTIYLFLTYSAKLITDQYNQQELKKINSSVRNLDIVFIVDNTGSMGSEISEVKTNLETMINTIQEQDLLTGSVKYGVIAYRDYSDDYVTNAQDLTSDFSKVKELITKMEANGGADFPEAAADAFNKATSFSWRSDAIKIIIWIADAPPHSRISSSYLDGNSIQTAEFMSKSVIEFPSAAYSFSNPMPWESEVMTLNEIGVIIHSILVRNDQTTKAVMDQIGRITRGVVASLSRSDLITDLILGLVGEGLDRVRVSEYVDQEISKSLSEIKLISDVKEKQLYIRNNLRKTNIEVLRLLIKNSKSNTNTSENQTVPDDVNVHLQFQPIDIIDVNYSIKYINACEKYKVFCDMDSKIIPENGLISNFTSTSLPLKGIQSKINAFDGLAQVVLSQIYINNLDKAITGEYVFPLPYGAIVTDFKAIVNEEEIIGVVFEKAKANQLYQYAVQNGDSAYLLTQEVDNIFRINIGNLPSNSNIKIELTYVFNLEKVKTQEATTTQYRLTLPVNSFPTTESKYYDIALSLDVITNNKIDNIKSISHPSLNSIFETANDLKSSSGSTESLKLDRELVIDIFTKNELEKVNDTISISEYDNKLNSPYKKFGSIENPNSKDYPFYSAKIVVHPKIIKSDPINNVVLFVDWSSSTKIISSQLLSTIKKITSSIKQKVSGANSINFKLVLFNNECNVVIDDKIDIISDSSFNNLANKFNFTPGSRLSKCLKLHKYFEKEKTRIIVITDGYFTEELDSKDIIQYIVNKSVNSKVSLVGIGYNKNTDLLYQLANISGENPLLISPNDINDYAISSFVDSLLSDSFKTSIKFTNKANKVIYDSSLKNHTNSEIILNANLISSFKGEELILFALFNKSSHTINDIKNYNLQIKATLNGIDTSFEYFLGNLVQQSINSNQVSKSNIVDVSAAKSVMNFYTQILTDLNNFKFSLFIDNNEQNIDSSLKTKENNFIYQYEIDYNVDIKELLKKRIVNLGVSYKISSQESSFIAMSEKDLEKYLKKLDEESSYDDATSEQIFEGDATLDTKFFTNTTAAHYEMIATAPYESIMADGLAVLDDKNESTQYISLNILFLIFISLILL